MDYTDVLFSPSRINKVIAVTSISVRVSKKYTGNASWDSSFSSIFVRNGEVPLSPEPRFCR